CRRTARRCDETQSASPRGHEGVRAQSRVLALAFRSPTGVIIPQENYATMYQVCPCRKYLYYNNDRKTKPECALCGIQFRRLAVRYWPRSTRRPEGAQSDRCRLL